MLSKRQACLAAISLVLLTRQTAIASPPTPAPKLPIGGIPPLCYVQQVRQTADPGQRNDLLLQQLSRYKTAGATDLGLQWANALDARQFAMAKLDAVLWLTDRAVQTQDWPQAKNLLVQAVQLTTSLSGEPQPFILLQLGWHFVAVSQPDQAAQMFARSLQAYQTLKRSPTQKAEFLMAIANGYIAIGQTQRATALLNQSQAILRSLPDKFEVAPPKFVLLGRLNTYYAANGQFDQANQLFAQALDLAISPDKSGKFGQPLEGLFQTVFDEPSPQVLSQLPEARQAQLQALQRQQQAQIIEQQVQVLARRPLERRDGQRQQQAQSTGRQLDRLSQQQVERRDRQQAYWELAEMWVETNQRDTAVAFAKTLKDPEDRATLLVALIDILGKTVGLEQAAPLLEPAQQSAQAIPDENERFKFLQNIVAAYGDLGQMDAAFQVLQSFSKNSSQHWFLVRTMVDTLIRRDQLDAAVNLLNEYPLPRQLPKAMADSYWEVLIHAYAQRGQFDRALQLSNRLTDPTNAFMAISRELAKVGETDHAIAMIQRIPEPLMQEIAWQGLISQAVAQGNWPQAQVLVQQLPARVNRASYQRQIVLGYAEARQYDQARQLASSLADPRLIDLLTCVESAQRPAP